MRLPKVHVPSDRRNEFFIKTLSVILVFCLLLVSLIFLLIYRNMKKQNLNTSYDTEYEVISNISYSSVIMQDTAVSMLQQLNSSPVTQQLIYSLDTSLLQTIQAMRTLQSYTRASQWFDSIYVYCAKEDRVCYSYVDGSDYRLTFTPLNRFFDSEFIQTLSESNVITQLPQMRTIQYTDTLPEKTVFTYVLPVRSSRSTYDGFFIVNVNADRLMYLGTNLASVSSRQLIVADSAARIYVDGQSLTLSDSQSLVAHILDSQESSGQVVMPESDTICTWVRSEQTGLYFLSCISYSDFTQQLSALTRWIMFYYIAVLLFAALISVYLAFRVNREYSALQERFSRSEKRYSENYQYIKQSILRSFFTLRSTDFIVGRQFVDNGIALEQYSAYVLFLLHVSQRHPSSEVPAARSRRSHIFLLEQLSRLFPAGSRYELVDMLQGRFLLVCEPVSGFRLDDFSEKLHGCFSCSAEYTLSGVYTGELTALDQLPESYRALSSVMDLLFFYPADPLICLRTLRQHEVVGNQQIESVRSEVIQALVNQRFEDASSILGNFFDVWFEPVGEVPYTIDALLSGFSEYISTFKRTYAISMDFNPSHFRSEALRADSSRAVKQLFLDLIVDISYAFASVENRSNYIDDILRFIEENYADPKINVDILADHVGLSSSHIQSIFKTATGSTISVYLRNLRIRKATELLEQTDIPISEIAESTGFGSFNYFCTVFKRHHSVTPTEYRANSRTK